MENKKIFLMVVLIINIFSVIYAKTIDFVEPTDVYKISEINNLWNGGATFSVWVRPLTADNTGRIAFQENDWELFTEEIQRNHISLIFRKNFSVSPLVISMNSELPKESWSHLSVSYDLNDLPTIYLNGEEMEYSIINEAKGNPVNGKSTELLIGNNNSYNNFDGLMKDVIIVSEVLSSAEISDLMDDRNEDFFTKFSVKRTSSENNEAPVSENLLAQNYPNPFVASTTISFNVSCKDATNAMISIYNVKGQKIREYAVSNGQTSIVFDGKDQSGSKIAAGIYFYKLQTNSRQTVKRMILSR